MIFIALTLQRFEIQLFRSETSKNFQKTCENFVSKKALYAGITTLWDNLENAFAVSLMNENINEDEEYVNFWIGLIGDDTERLKNYFF